MGKRKKKDASKTENQVFDEAQNDTMDEETQDEASETQELSAEEELQIKFNELNDKYLRLYSDFENFRKRTIKEKSQLISSASSNVLADLLPILDDFERAIEHNIDVDDTSSIKEGFLLIYNKFKNTLEGKGLKPMESKGDVFDIDHHEAVTNIPVEDDDQKGKVVDVIEKGYYLNDKVLRYAKVVVGQ